MVLGSLCTAVDSVFELSVHYNIVGVCMSGTEGSNNLPMANSIVPKHYKILRHTSPELETRMLTTVMP